MPFLLPTALKSFTAEHHDAHRSERGGRQVSPSAHRIRRWVIVVAVQRPPAPQKRSPKVRCISPGRDN